MSTLKNINSEGLNFTKSIPKPLESYGLNSVITDENGNLYFYFSTGTIFSGKVLAVTLAGKNYSGVALGSDEAGYQITLTDNPILSYQSHVQNFGWEDAWSESGQLSGTTGEGLKVEAIKIQSDLDGLGVKYRGHSQNIGWMDWAENGATAGTQGRSKSIEGIQIVVLPAALGDENEALLAQVTD